MAHPASADFSGKVVGVTDGDTVTVLDGRIQVKVRLSEIDAPEKAQPFGNRAKQALSNLVHGQEVRVVGNAKDRNGRTIGKLYRDNLDVNAEMVRLGMFPKSTNLFLRESHSPGLRDYRYSVFLPISVFETIMCSANGWVP